MATEKRAGKEASDRVQRKRGERRARIVEAAFAAIAEHGPADFSLNQLARDLDYTPSALYWYFPSKEALVLEIQKSTFVQLTGLLHAARAGWTADPALARANPAVRAVYGLLCQARWYLQLERTAPALFRIVAFSLDPRILLDAEQGRELMVVVGGLFVESSISFAQAEQADALSPGNAVHRAVQYWGALHSLALTGKLQRLDASLFRVEDLALASAETLLLGWGAAPRTLAAARTRLAGAGTEARAAD
jgi:AcrR family transcriptional regulator